MSARSVGARSVGAKILLCTRVLYPCLPFLLATGLAWGQQPDKESTVDLSGTWKWERTFNENRIDYTLQLKHKDDALTGTYKTVFENARRLSDPVEIENGKVDGNDVSFSVTRSFNGNGFTVFYSGKVSGDKIHGNAKVDFGNGEREFDWSAARVVSIEDVVGKWKLKFEVQDRAIQSSFDLDKDGDGLKGTYHSGLFGEHPIKQIELKDNMLSFTVDFETDNGILSVSYQAKPGGDQLTGVIVTNFGGTEYQTPFTGSRATADGDDDDRGDDDEA